MITSGDPVPDPHMNSGGEPTPFDQKLFIIFIVTFASMTVFEFVGQFLYPFPPNLRSGLITSLFVSGLAVIIAYFPLNAYYNQAIRLHSEIERRHAVEMILRKSENSLRQANRQINLMTSITRHDINNQLTALQGYLTLLEKKEPDFLSIGYVQKAATATERIFSMIQFTKEYETIGVNSPEWQDCRTLIETAEKEIHHGHILVKNDFPVGSEVCADPLIVKVFYNLIDNAVKYGGKITTIRFSAEETKDNYLILCEDNGDGIPVADKEAYLRTWIWK